MNFRSVVKKVIPRQAFRKIEPLGHKAEAVMWNVKHGWPAKGLKFIGVTGTNGKTSTCLMIHRMLTNAGYKVGLMTTVAYGVGNEIKPQVEHMTTVTVPKLHQRINEMKAAGAEWIIFEVTSHALAQGRTIGVPFDVAVLTNLTHEHLDYHGTFEKYRDAKRVLFKQTDRNTKGLRTGVINADDPNADWFARDVKNPMLYGFKKGDLKASDVKLTPAGSTFVATAGNDQYWITCKLPGSFNVSNALAAIGVGRALGLTKEQIEKGIAALEAVEGRMTRVDEGQDFDVIVDYAHTPDSFEKLFKDLKPVVKGKLIALFGSAGRRDEAKRAVQGKIAGQYADEVIVTEEDDRDLDGLEIMNQIASRKKLRGFDGVDKIEVSRAEATKGLALK